MNCLDNLNADQQIAVTTTEGPVLTLSGAGTGKTRVLTSRIIYILQNKLALPWQILALTFTNKAANEMSNRIAQYPDCAVMRNDIWMGTFHSICLRILRSNYEKAGLRKDFLVFGEDDQKAVLKSIITDMGIDPKEYNPSDLIETISNIKDKGILEEDKLKLSGHIKKIYRLYNAELRRLNAVDFGDIILNVLRLFASTPEILSKYQHQFKYILVDEFQDTNAAQMQFLKMLTKDTENPNIFCVGDDDQSIYSWRGAEIKNILDFEKTYPGTKIIRLEINYRSTGNILGAANSIIANNSERLGKTLKTAPDIGMGEPVYVLTVPNEKDEAKLISYTIGKNCKGNYSDYAVLIRSGSLSRVIEEEFTLRGIPYKVVGATKFYDRSEIRDVIAYARLLVYPFDDLSFLRIISKPRRGFGEVALDKLKAVGKSLMEGLSSINLSAKQQAAATEFLNAFDISWRDMAPADAVKQLLENSGYIKMWSESKDVDAHERLEHIRELIQSVISKYDSLPDFLEHAALMTTEDDVESVGTNVVSIMTIHAAKGLEFENVFLPAWEEGIFPHDKSIKEEGLEEERRLAYVAITRAKKHLVITNTMSRVLFGQQNFNNPSMFIEELDKRFINTGEQYNPEQHKSIEEDKKTKLVGKMVAHKEFGRGVIIGSKGSVFVVAFKDKGIKNVELTSLEIDC
ncbi:MAG: UvrD-helicase domain-containing protein [Alphaproteobacteria bacterium]|nr:UvrD-helicase domain-containing protein [Alphaproteobacteria bacterium]